MSSIPRLGRPPGGGNGNPLQCSCLENSMHRGAWQATVHGLTKSQTRLSNWARTHRGGIHCFFQKEFGESKQSHGEGNGTPLQYSCLENPMNRGAWLAAVHGIAKSQTRLSNFTLTSLSCIGEGNGNPLQCSCLENPRDGGAWWAAVYGVAQSRPRLTQLSKQSQAKSLKDA